MLWNGTTCCISPETCSMLAQEGVNDVRLSLAACLCGSWWSCLYDFLAWSLGFEALLGPLHLATFGNEFELMYGLTASLCYFPAGSLEVFPIARVVFFFILVFNFIFCGAESDLPSCAISGMITMLTSAWPPAICYPTQSSPPLNIANSSLAVFYSISHSSRNFGLKCNITSSSPISTYIVICFHCLSITMLPRLLDVSRYLNLLFKEILLTWGQLWPQWTGSTHTPSKLSFR